MHRVAAAAIGGLLALGLVAGCGSDSSDGAGTRPDGAKRSGDEVKVGDNNSFSIGDAQLPDDFPEDAVPLPEADGLQAVVTGRRDGIDYYSLTYAIRGRDLKTAAKTYEDELRDDGYAIETSSSVGPSSGAFAAFTAVGKKWDVVVYSGGSEETDGAMSLQVTTHDPLKDLPGS